MNTTIDLNLIVRQLRIVSGLILLTYAALHLLNHSVGLISLNAADNVRVYFHALWRNPIGNFLLYGSLIVHIILAFYTIFSKSSYKITKIEWLQLIFPLIALWWLAQHIFAGFTLNKIYGVEESYDFLTSIGLLDQESPSPWIPSIPAYIYNAATFGIMTLFIWGHGVIGLHRHLRFKSVFYNTNFNIFLFIYWIVPIAAVLGYFASLKEKSLLGYIYNLETQGNLFYEAFLKIPQESHGVLFPVIYMIDTFYPFIFLGIVLIVILNLVRVNLFGKIIVQYPEGKDIKIPKGVSVLEASRIAGIPHVSVCGGKGRCTTCRVKIISGLDNVNEPNSHEASIIKRLGFENDVRLACQLKPTKNISVLPLLNPETKEIKARTPVGLSGKEKETVVVFIDLREFTKLSEKKLPYDVVYILNKYYSVCGEIIENNKGRLDKFIGDGIMAIFDGSQSSSENSKNSIKAAKLISKAIKDLNNQMKIDFAEELRFGIGIHKGNTIVGMMGYGETVTETVVGDNVNIASRLEELNKKYKTELVVSKDVLEAAKINTKQFTSEKIKIRGRSGELEIFSLENASKLSI